VVVYRELATVGGPQPIPGAVVAVWVPGKGEFTKGFGYSKLQARTPMPLDDHLRTDSNTKTLIATVLLQLVDEGKLRLDGFNPGLALPKEQRTAIRELAEMHSGIIDV
jgi:D-alanyl-D-alanine carboxypeptidase